MDALVTHAALWCWLGFALMLGIIEILAGTQFFMLWAGVAALIAAIIVGLFPNTPVHYQCLIFGLLTLGSFVLWGWYIKTRYTSQQPASHLNQRALQYIGQQFELAEAIHNGRGRIRIGDGMWLVTGPDLPMGTKVRVTSVDGSVLIVMAIL